MMVAVMLGADLKPATEGRGAKAAQEPSGISLDEENQVVTVAGVRVPVRGQSYKLLSHLFAHLSTLWTRLALVAQVIGERYDEFDASQVARLSTVVRWLREKIEAAPGHPRLLRTEPQGGYRLVMRYGS